MHKFTHNGNLDFTSHISFYDLQQYTKLLTRIYADACNEEHPYDYTEFMLWITETSAYDLWVHCNDDRLIRAVEQVQEIASQEIETHFPE